MQAPEQVRTSRLLLRRANDHDLDEYCERIYLDDTVMRTLPAGHALNVEQARERATSVLLQAWQQEGFGPWLVTDPETNRIYGHCGLRYWPDSPEVEVLYALERRAWGSGFATEAARAALSVARDHLQLHRIIAGVFDDNPASSRVLQKLGMHKWKRREFAGRGIQMYQINFAEARQ